MMDIMHDIIYLCAYVCVYIYIYMYTCSDKVWLSGFRYIWKLHLDCRQCRDLRPRDELCMYAHKLTCIHTYIHSSFSSFRLSLCLARVFWGIINQIFKKTVCRRFYNPLHGPCRIAALRGAQGLVSASSSMIGCLLVIECNPT